MIPGSLNTMMLGQVATAPVTPVNYALASNGGTATASATDYGSPSDAINGNRAGTGVVFWRSNAGGSGMWLQITLAASQPIRELNIFDSQTDFFSPVDPTPAMTTVSQMGTFDFQYWDGAAWTTLSGGTYPDNNLVWKQLILASPVTATQFRVYWPTASGFAYKDVCEFELWT